MKKFLFDRPTITDLPCEDDRYIRVINLDRPLTGRENVQMYLVAGCVALVVGGVLVGAYCSGIKPEAVIFGLAATTGGASLSKLT